MHGFPLHTHRHLGAWFSGVEASPEGREGGGGGEGEREVDRSSSVVDVAGFFKELKMREDSEALSYGDQ